MLAANQPRHPVVEIVKGERVVTRVPPGRLKPQPSNSENPDSHQCQTVEANKRRSLGHLIERQAANGNADTP
jgi:hypothetical protein